MIMVWVVVALVTWPLLALGLGLLLGRGIAAAESTVPRGAPRTWVPRELPSRLVAPVGRTPTRV
ncbi:MAG: hypothetical protein ACJ735_14755 [Actinomycetes bacterium]